MKRISENEEACMENYWSITMTEDQLRSISSIGLAHLGDGVYELLVRTWLCAHGKATGKGLHQATIRLVRAEAQARRADAILPLLTEEERSVFRRGRNAQVNSVPSHASRAQYSTATALEALLGWLYLRGERERINALFCEMMKVED
jgi:ribonuclease-3 family protein